MRVAVLSLLMIGCSSGWVEAFDAVDAGAQSGVWGSAPDDVYVVGGAPDDGVITRYDGDDWNDVDIPASDLLVWVYGFGPDDVWAVGEGGSVLHKTAEGWTSVDVGTTEALWGVWGSAPDDLWMVGGDVAAGDPVLIHYDGSTFTPTPLDPAQNDRNARSIFKVFGIDGEVFAVGQNGLMIRWDGTAWMQLPAGADANQDFVSLWATSLGDLKAVGGRSGARLATYDGSAWTTEAPTGFPGLNAISVTDRGTWVGGQSGFVAEWTDEGLVREDPPEDTPFDIHAMWDDGEDRVYAVGGQFREPFQGVAWVRRTP